MMDYSEKEAITNRILSKLANCSKEYMHAFETVIGKFLRLEDEDREIVSLDCYLRQELPPIYQTYATGRLHHIVGHLPPTETERLLLIAKRMYQQHSMADKVENNSPKDQDEGTHDYLQ